jgi:hypothetical protein
MSFPEWAEAIVAGVRRYLPGARAVRKGARTVIVRHGEREAQLVDDDDAFVISFTAGDMKTTMSSLIDRDRRDAHRSAGRASRGQRLEIEPLKQQRTRRRGMGR